MDLKITVLVILNILSFWKLKHCSSLPNYDYIIVGAGSAGATLANRLSDDNFAKVLLLEAGEKAPNNTEIPILLGYYGSGTSLNWNYTIEPNGFSCLGSNNNACDYYMGRTLGGSSQINYMLYVRGSRMDYDLWAKNGATGWSFKDVLPYFKKSESVTISPKIIEESLHGKNGPQTVSITDYSTELKKAYLDGVIELGFKNVDYNGEQQEGFGVSQLNTRDGYRCSTEKSYLQPAYSRRNLKIITSALVTKVIIDEFKVTTGVTYLKDGKSHNVFANREVILSAGAIKSPQILLLSGIGPKDHLEELKIKVVADLPVGQNLQDHVSSNAIAYTLNATTVPNFNDIINYTSQTHYNFPRTLTGVLSSPNLLEVFGYSKSPFEKIKGDYNDVQYFFLSQIVPQQFFKQEILSYLEKFYDKPAVLLLPALLHPKSRGNITLKSTDPTAAPRISTNFFSHPQDIFVLLHGIKTVMKLAEKTKAFSKFNATLLGPVPFCENYPFKSDDYLLCTARTYTISLYHACGTCKMGRLNDQTTVVDTSLRVKGIQHLRVVDASIMPTIVSANTNAATIMIAEKAADIIKNQYKKNFKDANSK